MMGPKKIVWSSLSCIKKEVASRVMDKVYEPAKRTERTFLILQLS